MSRNGFLLSVCIGAVALHACSKSAAPVSGTGDESPVPAASSPTPAATAPDATAASAAPDAPAESSLALKRGTLTLASNQATFQPCGAPSTSQTMLWVVDQTDGVLRHAFSGQSMPLELYIEAYGERTASVPDTEAARGYTGTFILEEVLYATPPAEAPGCKEPPPTFIVSARGNEPFWAVEVTGEKMIWRQPDEPKEITIDAPQSQDSEGTVGYAGESGGHKLELYVEGEVCRDSMSGAFSAYSARAVFDGKEFKGCARIGE